MDTVVHENLQRLRELTETLPKFPIGSPVEMEGKYTMSYPMVRGECLGGNLMLVDDVMHITKWYNSQHTQFPEHSHKSFELIFVYIGRMNMTVEGEVFTVGTGEHISIKPNKRHQAYFSEDTYYISITYPPAEGFPNE